MSLDEFTFETEIVAALTQAGGYAEGAVSHFDVERGIDTAELAAFIGATQADEWSALIALHGGDPNVAQRAFYDRLAKEIDARGTVDVLRRGVIDLGVAIQLAYFRPAHGLTPELVRLYGENRLTVTRQLAYERDSAKTLDLGLFVNGLLVATAEIKNPLTGQTVEDAKAQYRVDRDPRNVSLARRAVVHFAVDTEQVAMTTRLSGPPTEFLPFNRGRDGGAGNPPDPSGHRTIYLWREVWQRDNWLDLLQRFVHASKQVGGRSKAPALTIFPRYHQWDAVRKLETAARAEGAGHDYLVEHSAGSGKSNTIGWLAHRLAGLHSDVDLPVFDKVVVITDRRVLDSQLQDTIYQFDHAHGVVQKIDEDSGQLADALLGPRSRIIITTLQKFPVVLRQGTDLPNRAYAVIIDEAHSSQTGENIKDLKLVLGGRAESGEPEEGELAAAEAAEHAGGLDGEPPDPVAAVLEAGARARGRQANISFFAFTATPKGRTLEQFGHRNAATGKYEPFHLYTMRQAIEEGFILDVLASYLTYATYWKIEKAVTEDPSYDTAKARNAIARFVSLHEHNLAQKAEIIIEHYRRHVQGKIGGRAKAMVVTSSRLHAVRYQQALTRYCQEHGYGTGVLVAFSGTVTAGAEDWTEARMNGFPESQTPARFADAGANIMVVAEKYQTGFDQPLLYAMYVDKALTGLAAVQTLSRLNRTSDGKDGTFVLDFRNDAGDIRDSFAPWYTSTVAQPTDPNLLYDTRHALDPFGVLYPEEIERTTALIVSSAPGSHARVHAALAPVIDRFRGLDTDRQSEFRDALGRFVRTYSFLSQVVTFTDIKLEADYLYCRALQVFIRPAQDAGLDLGRAVELTHLRTEQTFDGSVALDADTHGEVSTISSGAGPQHQPEEEPLSQIISELNDRFGTSFAPEDRVFYDVVADKLAARPDIQQAAAVNTAENFKIVLMKAFTDQVVAQMATSEDLALKLIDHPEIRDLVVATYLPFIQGRARVAWQEHCPIGDLLGPDRESGWLEYKSTLRTHVDSGQVYKPLETAVLKTICAFANSRDGGTLLIGVADDGTPCGLASDYASLRKPGKDDRDLFQLHLVDVVTAAMGGAAAAQMSVQIHSVDGSDVCRVQVHPSPVPVEATVTVVVKGQAAKKTAFFVRSGNSSRELGAEERAKYVLGRWPGPLSPSGAN